MRDHAFPCTGALNPHVRVNLFVQNFNKNWFPFHTPLFVLFLWILARFWASLEPFWWSLFDLISQKNLICMVFHGFWLFSVSLHRCSISACQGLHFCLFFAFPPFWDHLGLTFFLHPLAFAWRWFSMLFCALFNDFLTQYYHNFGQWRHGCFWWQAQHFWHFEPHMSSFYAKFSSSIFNVISTLFGTSF